MKILDVSRDDVIKSTVLIVKTTYKFAIDNLCPLLNSFEEQRGSLSSSIYKTLERDMINGCVVPPLTIAYIKDNVSSENDKLEALINNDIEKAFILDGIQRLTTLLKASKNISPEVKDEFDKRSLYINVLITPSKDKLLYRMITLNNGQKPMTARHQIEILANQFIDFNQFDIEFSTEKEKNKGDMKKDILVKGYLAFSTRTSNLDNQKIIDDMMNQLIMKKIVESNFIDSDIEYDDIIKLVKRITTSEFIKKWIKIDNNFIGFCAGISFAYDLIKGENIEILEERISVFEEAFSKINVSKVKLGMTRRKLVEYFIKNYDKLKNKDMEEMVESFMEII